MFQSLLKMLGVRECAVCRVHSKIIHTIQCATWLSFQKYDVAQNGLAQSSFPHAQHSIHCMSSWFPGTSAFNESQKLVASELKVFHQLLSRQRLMAFITKSRTLALFPFHGVRTILAVLIEWQSSLWYLKAGYKGMLKSKCQPVCKQSDETALAIFHKFDTNVLVQQF